MYLGIAVLTLNNQTHTYIRILPSKTKVNKDNFSENNLDCLIFDECDPKHYFDRETKYIYLKIDDIDHQLGYIE